MSEIARPVERNMICRIVNSVAAALHFAHSAGHPHRDVKPHNIIELTDEDGDARWVLADWGLTRRAPGETTAEWTKTGQLLGSAGFAPPEAYQNAHNVGAPGDVYALGQVIAWATGVDPVPNVRPTVAAPWRQLVEPMTHLEARDRLQTIAEVRRLLSTLCDCDGAAMI
jgi:serine/threonine protein kinase